MTTYNLNATDVRFRYHNAKPLQKWTDVRVALRDYRSH